MAGLAAATRAAPAASAARNSFFIAYLLMHRASSPDFICRRIVSAENEFPHFRTMLT
jgi:hypothetical protein